MWGAAAAGVRLLPACRSTPDGGGSGGRSCRDTTHHCRWPAAAATAALHSWPGATCRSLGVEGSCDQGSACSEGSRKLPPSGAERGELPPLILACPLCLPPLCWGMLCWGGPHSVASPSESHSPPRVGSDGSIANGGNSVVAGLPLLLPCAAAARPCHAGGAPRRVRGCGGGSCRHRASSFTSCCSRPCICRRCTCARPGNTWRHGLSSSSSRTGRGFQAARQLGRTQRLSSNFARHRRTCRHAPT